MLLYPRVEKTRAAECRTSTLPPSAMRSRRSIPSTSGSCATYSRISRASRGTRSTGPHEKPKARPSESNQSSSRVCNESSEAAPTCVSRIYMQQQPSDFRVCIWFWYIEYARRVASSCTQHTSCHRVFYSYLNLGTYIWSWPIYISICVIDIFIYIDILLRQSQYEYWIYVTFHWMIRWMSSLPKIIIFFLFIFIYRFRFRLIFISIFNHTYIHDIHIELIFIFDIDINININVLILL